MLVKDVQINNRKETDKIMEYKYIQEYFAEAFLRAEKLSMPERIAAGTLAAAEHLSIDFPENCMLPTVSLRAPMSACGYGFGSGIFYSQGMHDWLVSTYPERREEMEDLRRRILPYCTHTAWMESATEEELLMRDTYACWGGDWGGHGNPDYGRLLKLGTDGLRTLVNKYKEVNTESEGFYNACLTVLDAADTVGRRIREMSLSFAEAETDGERKREWLRIAETFTRLPREGAWDMYSAMMLFWMFFTMDGNDSPGRMDQFMIDFYRKSSPAQNSEMIDRFLEGMHNVRGWNLCISGSNEKGEDETNELSYAILEAVRNKGYQTPNLTMRVNPKTPEKLWQAAADCLATGVGLPAIYNDETVCPALEKIGISHTHAHEYCMNGCNQIDIMGKSHMGLEDGEVNFAKALELCLHDGCDYEGGERRRIMPSLGKAADCKNFSEFSELYFKYLDYVTDTSVSMSNKSQKIYAEYAPHPMRSCLIEGCLERGVDYNSGGPLYNHGQILAEGMADAADSLYAVKKLVFDTKKYSMEELQKALAANFENYETLWHDFSSQDKFGNDIPECDSICTYICDHYLKYLKTKKTYRGGSFTGGCSPYNRAAENGAHTGALPNGKRRGDPTLADSIAATPGRDKCGPTASLKSMMRYDQSEACSGFVAQLRFDKNLFNTEKGKAAFITLAKAYFAGGGQQLSVNVLDRETLLDAQRNPAAHGDLIVRVGGYSDYFANLTPELQQNIIDRTEFSV